jgi:hypothetical protein
MVPDGHSGISPTAFGVCLPMAVERHPPTQTSRFEFIGKAGGPGTLRCGNSRNAGEGFLTIAL